MLARITHQLQKEYPKPSTFTNYINNYEIEHVLAKNPPEGLETLGFKTLDRF